VQQYNTTTIEANLHFPYPDLHDPVLSQLRAIAKLKIDPNSSELEKAKTILGYAHRLFTHNGDNQPSSSDPVTIIEEALDGKELRCVEYCILGNALLWAYAIPARVVGLKTSDVETREYGAGHVVVEFWSKDNQKWIMCDVQAGIIPMKHKLPLSAFEFGEQLTQHASVDYLSVKGSRFGITKNSFADMHAYVDWVKEYLFFLDTAIDVTFKNVDRQKQKIAMLVPLDIAPPKMFQNMFEMNAVYTHSVLDFYAQPIH
jgi:transglutaminase-like putative cysteine protease